MQRSDFSYHLPPELIAKQPGAIRSASRMLLLNPATNELRDSYFSELAELLSPGDLLLFNDTRVIPARLYGVKDSGGRVEVLVERIMEHGVVLAHVRASKTPRAGSRLVLEGSITVRVMDREGDLFRLQFPAGADVLELLEKHGRIPLPPYLERADTEQDRERYQTVYATTPGAVAAPTAGLHFDADTLARLALRDIATARITLHVGTGTFQPVRVDDLAAHVMHQEYFEISADAIEAISRTRAAGGRIVAVGTTVVRTLESAARDGGLKPCSGYTDLFITPGFRFQVVDAMITNFHLPESTLLMLVCAFAGYHRTMNAYRHAIEAGYRFYSYGDAMFIQSREVA